MLRMMDSEVSSTYRTSNKLPLMQNHFSTMLGSFYLGCAGVLTEKNCLIYTNVLTQAFLPVILSPAEEADQL